MPDHTTPAGPAGPDARTRLPATPVERVPVERVPAPASPRRPALPDTRELYAARERLTLRSARHAALRAEANHRLTTIITAHDLALAAGDLRHYHQLHRALARYAELMTTLEDL